jgi:tetrahydromethanopterin S-methyltransferase subunit C
MNVNVIGERNPVLWGIEVLIAALTTVTLLPMLLLYMLDLAAGTIAPDAMFALGAAIGLIGIWLALLRPDSTYQRSALLRWCVIVILIIGTAILANLAWGSVRQGGTGFGIGLLATLAPVGVALHQIVRLLRL